MREQIDLKNMGRTLVFQLQPSRLIGATCSLQIWGNKVKTKDKN